MSEPRSRRVIRSLALGILAAAALTVAAPRAHAWGFYGHVGIGDEVADRLNLPADEHAWFVLGSLMGDLDKSDHLQGSIGGQGLLGDILRWLARFPRGYRFPPLVDQHDPAYVAELIERAADTGDRRLVAWALGVMVHGMSDRFTDSYPDPHYRVSSGDAEVAVDMKVFRHRSSGLHADQLRRIESGDHEVFGPSPHIPFMWWLGNVWSALKRGRDRDAQVLQADPFASLILDTHRAVHGAANGPANVSDVCRQQIAMDAFTWNYRLKAWFMPGWRSFARDRGDAWFDEVERKVTVELAPLCETTIHAWQDHLSRRAQGLPTTRPAIP